MRPAAVASGHSVTPGRSTVWNCSMRCGGLARNWGAGFSLQGVQPADYDQAVEEARHWMAKHGPLPL
jgi:hypothetical protein